MARAINNLNQLLAIKPLDASLINNFQKKLNCYWHLKPPIPFGLQLTDGFWIGCCGGDCWKGWVFPLTTPVDGLVMNGVISGLLYKLAGITRVPPPPPVGVEVAGGRRMSFQYIFPQPSNLPFSKTKGV